MREPRFIETVGGDTFHLVAALTNGDYRVKNRDGYAFNIPATAIKGVRY